MSVVSIQTLATTFINDKSEKNFSELIKRMKPGLIGFVFKYVNDMDLSKEIVSQVFINIWEKIDQYNDNYNFSTWAYAIAKNESLGALRLKKKYLSHEQLESNHSKVLKIYSPTVTIDLEIAGPNEHELIDVLHSKTVEEIYNLREPYRTVMIEREINEKQLQEISDSLDWNLSTVKTRLRKARKEIAISLEKNYPSLVTAYNELC